VHGFPPAGAPVATPGCVAGRTLPPLSPACQGIVHPLLWTNHEQQTRMTITTDQEPRHTIGAVAQRTGLSPDLLRVWERRYGVVDPARPQGGPRLYSDADILRLRLLRRLTEGGHSIGRIADLSVPELTRLLPAEPNASVGPAHGAA